MLPETFVIKYFNNNPVIKKTGLHAFGLIPPKPPQQFITVERTGGIVTEIIDDATIAIQVWAGSDAGAANLADIVTQQVLRMNREPKVAAVRITACSRWPDTVTNKARYQIVARVTIMANAGN